MSQRLPAAVLYFDKYTDTQLIQRAQKVHDGINANPFGVFTTPPVTMTQLQTYIDTYAESSALAIKGSKSQTATKTLDKQSLKLALKELAIYVTQLAQAISIPETPGTQLSVRNIILSSGFDVSKYPAPVAPIAGIEMVQVRRAISESAGTLKILVRQYTNGNRNTKLYQVQYRTSAIPGTTPVPAGEWQTQTFTGQNQILLTGLTSGLSYDYQVAAIGGRDAKRNEVKPVNYTPIASVVII